MRSVVLAFLIALCAVPALTNSKPVADPDFTWASNCSREVKAAQRSKDTDLIGDIDLAKACDQSGVLDASRTQSRL